MSLSQNMEIRKSLQMGTEAISCFLLKIFMYSCALLLSSKIPLDWFNQL